MVTKEKVQEMFMAAIARPTCVPIAARQDRGPAMGPLLAGEPQFGNRSIGRRVQRIHYAK